MTFALDIQPVDGYDFPVLSRGLILCVLSKWMLTIFGNTVVAVLRECFTALLPRGVMQIIVSRCSRRHSLTPPSCTTWTRAWGLIIILALYAPPCTPSRTSISTPPS